MARICILGIGNVLMRDDGVGPHVVRTLEARWSFPDDVSVVDAGTPGLDLTMFIQGLDALVVVDAVRAAGAPGELRIYDKRALLEKAPGIVMSPHDPGLRDALQRVEFLGGSPGSAVLVGIIPASVSTGVGLSDPVRAALPRVESEVLRQLAALGVKPAPRDPPVVPDLWWERGPA